MINKQCPFCDSKLKISISNPDIKLLALVAKRTHLSLPELAKKIGIAKKTIYRWLEFSCDKDFTLKNIYREKLKLISKI